MLTYSYLESLVVNGPCSSMSLGAGGVAFLKKLRIDIVLRACRSQGGSLCQLLWFGNQRSTRGRGRDQSIALEMYAHARKCSYVAPPSNVDLRPLH